MDVVVVVATAAPQLLIHHISAMWRHTDPDQSLARSLAKYITQHAADET